MNLKENKLDHEKCQINPKNLVTRSQKEIYVYFSNIGQVTLIGLGKESEHNLKIHNPGTQFSNQLC
jgi:hypothetical protein